MAMSAAHRMWRGHRQGQSTLEYILVVAAILVAVIVAANLVIKPAVNTAMTDSGSVITGATSKLKTKLGIDSGNSATPTSPTN